VSCFIGETAIYSASNIALTARLEELKSRGVNIDAEIALLGKLRARVTALCLQESYLERYRSFLHSQGYGGHPSGNKNHLRDTEDKYADGGHSFSFNREILYSYDVCGPCEAHAILYSMQRDREATVDNAKTLMFLDSASRIGNVNFAKCPS
jgi:hypothetical protein